MDELEMKHTLAEAESKLLFIARTGQREPLRVNEAVALITELNVLRGVAVPNEAEAAIRVAIDSDDRGSGWATDAERNAGTFE